MCLALYLGAERPLPLLPYPELPAGALDSPTWPLEAMRFHTAALHPEQEIVRRHFSVPHVVYAGSYEGCGCGFQYGREYPEDQTCERHLLVAAESLAALAEYLRRRRVRELFSGWHGEEAELLGRVRGVTVEELIASDAPFPLGQWCELEDGAGPAS